MGARCLAAGLLFATVAACGGGAEDRADPTAVPGGRRLVEQRGCLSCHTSDGRSGVGPTWKGLFGSQVRLTDGRTVKADRGYLVRSIAEPDADTVSGFPSGVMAGAMPGRPLTETEISEIVGCLETL